MVGASIVLASIIGLRYIDGKLFNHLAIRIIFALALTNLLNALSVFLTNAQAYNTWDNFRYELAGFQMLTRIFCNITNIATCFHLYRGLVRMKKSTWAFELAIWIYMLIIVALLMIGCYFLGFFTRTLVNGGCNPGPKNLSKTKSPSIVPCMAAMGGLSGLLTLTPFLADPTAMRSFEIAYKKIKRRSGEAGTKDSNLELMEI